MRLKEKQQLPEVDQRLLSLSELQAYLSIGQTTAWKVGRESNALVRIGRRVLYDRRKIDAYIDRLGA